MSKSLQILQVNPALVTPGPLSWSYMDILISPITSIINASLKQGMYHKSFRLKSVKNYRPVSNLNFFSKILVRVAVASHLKTNIDEASLKTGFQTAYRNPNSAESAHPNIQSYVLLDIAEGSVAAHSLLDFSAAFSTIDHTILLDRLYIYCGISDLTLCWIKSYLSDKTQSIKMGNTG